MESVFKMLRNVLQSPNIFLMISFFLRKLAFQLTVMVTGESKDTNIQMDI